MDAMKPFSILDMDIYPHTIADLHRLLTEAINTNNQVILAAQNLHSIYVHQHDKRVQEFHSLCHNRIDGMPIVILGRLLGYPISRDCRVTWLDWLDPFMQKAQNEGWRIYYLGSRPGVGRRGLEILQRSYPRLQVAESHGYFEKTPGSPQNETVLNDIRSFGPDILLVGMGMPIQEHWILDNREKTGVRAIIRTGALMEYIAGEVSTPPRWMGRWGLEWLFRFLENPKRFGRRYLIEPWHLSIPVMKELYARFRLREHYK